MAVQNRGVVASILPGLTPLQHCSRALELPSPFAFTANGDDDLLPPELKSAVQRLAELNDPVSFWKGQMAKLRLRVEKWKIRESTLNSKVHPRVAEQAARFPSLAFEELLREHNYDDPEAPRLLKGAPLTGEMGGRASWPLNPEPN